VTFHPEASDHVDRSLALIRHYGCKAGLAINPATTLSCLEHVMDKLDIILIMSVNPGFGGQTFIPAALEKLKKARALINQSGKHIWLAIDGGIKVENIHVAAQAGADMFIAGSAIFTQPNYTDVIRAMRHQLKK
jgi:ribulose-phosphate 3-epimerase